MQQEVITQKCNHCYRIFTAFTKAQLESYIINHKLSYHKDKIKVVEQVGAD